MDLKILCIGDSITFGYPYNQNSSWVYLTQLATSITMINKGVNGDTTAAMSYRLKRDCLTLNPTHIIIMGGTNDAYTNEPLEMVRDNIKTMARKAEASNIKPVIALPIPAGTSYIESNLKKYRLWMMNFAQEYNLNLIDFAQVMVDEKGRPNPNLFFDDVHPNKKGYQVMSSVVIKFLSNLIIS